MLEWSKERKDKIQNQVLGIAKVEEIRSKKRIKYSVEPPKKEPDYKKAFLDLRDFICKDYGIYLCSNCTYLDVDQVRKWESCEVCQSVICSECLPEYERKNKEIRNVFYCSSCTEKGEFSNDTKEVDPGHKRITMLNGDIYMGGYLDKSRQ